MAIINPIFATVTLKFRDQSGPTSMSFNMGPAAGGVLPDVSNSDVRAFINELYSSVLEVSDLTGQGWNVVYSARDDAAPVYGDSPDRERKLVWQFTIPSTGKTALVTLPGPDYAVWDVSGEIVPFTGTLDTPSFTGTLASHLQSVHDKLRNGATSGALNFPVVDSNGEDFGALAEPPYKQHRKSTRG